MSEGGAGGRGQGGGGGLRNNSRLQTDPFGVIFFVFLRSVFQPRTSPADRLSFAFFWSYTIQIRVGVLYLAVSRSTFFCIFLALHYPDPSGRSLPRRLQVDFLLHFFGPTLSRSEWALSTPPSPDRLSFGYDSLARCHGTPLGVTDRDGA